MAISKPSAVTLGCEWIKDDEVENLPTVRVENAPLSVNSIPIDYPDLPEAQGRIEGAWKVMGNFCKDEDRVASQKFLLPAGETLRVPEGTAVAVQDEYEDWVIADFPLGGRLLGPLVYAQASPEDPQELVRELTRKERWSKIDRWSMVVGISSICTMTGSGLIAGLLKGAGIAESTDLSITVLYSVAAVSLVGAIGGMLFPSLGERLSDKREKRRPEDLTLPPRIDWNIDLPIRLRSLSGYSPEAISARLAHYKSDNFDTDITEALAGYRHRRRVLSERGEPLDSTLEHSAKMIAEIEQKIAGSPQLLCNQEVKARYLDLIRRAEGQVNKRIEARAEALSADVLSDIAMLVKQIER